MPHKLRLFFRVRVQFRPITVRSAVPFRKLYQPAVSPRPHISHEKNGSATSMKKVLHHFTIICTFKKSVKSLLLSVFCQLRNKPHSLTVVLHTPSQWAGTLLIPPSFLLVSQSFWPPVLISAMSPCIPWLMISLKSCTPCSLRGHKNRSTLFPGRMS